MKILHILYSGLGGHGNVFFSMAAADKNHLHSYEALFTGVEEIKEEYSEKCISMGIRYQYVKKYTGKHLRYFFKIINAIRRSDCDIIFLHGSMLVMAAKAASLFSGKKIVVRETQANHLKTLREKYALRLAMKYADKIVFLSDAYREGIVAEMKNKFNHAKCEVIPNGIDLDVFKPGIPRLPSAEFNIGMQSRILPIKDHPTLIAAFDKLNMKFPELNARLNIAGDGHFMAEIKKQADEAGLHDRVRFYGMLPETALPQFLNNQDIYVHASLGETMSTAIMQAMACGNAIIASDVDGIKNMINDGETGLLVPVQDINSLTSKLELLVADESLRDQLSVSALAYARQQFSSERMLNKYTVLFNKVIAKQVPG